MNKEEIESIVKDVIEFVEEEFFKTSAVEKKDLAKFLRERLAAQPSVQADGEYCACRNNPPIRDGYCMACRLPKLPVLWQWTGRSLT